MTQVQPVQSSRRNSFDAVRLIAAFSVLLAHQLNIAGYDLPGYGQPALGPFGPKLADAGLYVFFALSGYLVFQSLNSDPRPLRFLRARGLRIYPGAIVNTMACLLFGALDTGEIQSSYWLDPQTWLYFWHNSTIIFTPTQFQLPGVMSESRWPAVNVPTWTLKYEIFCYFELFIVYKIASRVHSVLQPALFAIAGSMIALFIYTRLAPPVAGPGLESLGSINIVHLTRFTMVFFCGAAYAASEPWTIAKRAMLLALTCLYLSLFPLLEASFTSMILILGGVAIEIGKSRLLYSETYHRIGDLSYGTYLYAFPIQMITLSHWLTVNNFWIITSLDILAILGCAFLSWRFIERPALRWKQGRREPSANRTTKLQCAEA